MRDFEGETWTQNNAWYDGNHNKVDPRELGLKVMHAVSGPNLSDVEGTITTGDNSGYQAIGLAWQFAGLGPCTIILLGYDMQDQDGRRHWFGDHPQELNNTADFRQFIRFYETIDRDGVNIINCSRNTALKCFPRMDLDECIAAISQRAA